MKPKGDGIGFKVPGIAGNLGALLDRNKAIRQVCIFVESITLLHLEINYKYTY